MYCTCTNIQNQLAGFDMSSYGVMCMSYDVICMSCDVMCMSYDVICMSCKPVLQRPVFEGLAQEALSESVYSLHYAAGAIQAVKV